MGPRTRGSAFASCGDDVASAYAFLASYDAEFISGAALVVDGAQTAVM